ncbi:DEAD/DEAH box helicase [Tepidibacillus infernus]|uniref:DEAD/DEAH box helicase n=1 Tax=Tepidibacillus infernus TaxID=1806172 RepID=UPI003B69CD2C
MKFQVYGVQLGQKMSWNITLSFDIDLMYWYEQGIKELVVVDSLMSIGHAMAYRDSLDKSKESRLVERSLLFWKSRESGEKYTFARNDVFSIRATYQGFNHILLKYEEWKQEIIPFVEGKQLLLEEIITLLKKHHTSPHLTSTTELSNYLQVGYLLNEINISSGVSAPQSNRTILTPPLVCHRCGSTEKVMIQPCASCGEHCATCESCITMGRSKTCTPLIHFSASELAIQDHSLDLPSFTLQLSPHQEHIANHAVRFANSKEFKELLIWAVTGAGKTEMIFPVVYNALKRGNRILLASPRKDVIKELSPRFRTAFPGVAIVSLYGGSEEKWNSGQLYLATTHQTMRFVQFFDLVIVDEMDAFPYHNDTMLEFVVKRALKEEGKMIFMTATPSNKWLDRVQRKEIDSVILPIRYHHHPLPVPQIERIPKKEKVIFQANPDELIRRFIDEVKVQKGQAFIFIANVRDIPIWTKKLKQWFPDETIAGVYASDRGRDEKVEAFRNGEIQFLVTTTIMERGVTVPNVHVLVIGAESTIFDEATLVQIAGRVGRSANYPTGIVWFLAEYKTNAMLKAKKQIERMNRLAKGI